LGEKVGMAVECGAPQNFGFLFIISLVLKPLISNFVSSLGSSGSVITTNSTHLNGPVDHHKIFGHLIFAEVSASDIRTQNCKFYCKIAFVHWYYRRNCASNTSDIRTLNFVVEHVAIVVMCITANITVVIFAILCC